MFLWPCIVSKAWRKKTNKMQQYRWFIVNCGCWLLTTVSTCFGHLYAHLQEKMGIKMPETCWDSVNNQHPQLTINHLYCCLLLVFFLHIKSKFANWKCSGNDEANALELPWFEHECAGLFEMIVGVLTTCHAQYTWDRSICVFYLIEQHSKFLLHTLQLLYMCASCDSTNINTIF